MNKIESMPDYLDSPAIGSGTFKEICLSPKDFAYKRKYKDKSSSSQNLGTLIHSFMLEPDKFNSQYLLQPEDWGPLTKNPGRQKWDQLKEQAKSENKTPVKWSEGEYLVKLKNEAGNHSNYLNLVKHCTAEVSFYATIDGFDFKSREDLWCEKTGEVWDVKTTSKGLDDDSLSKQIFFNGYHFSAAHHMKVMEAAGFPVTGWGWVFVSTATPAPHIVIKKASKEMLDTAFEDWNTALEILKNCEKKQVWPGLSQDIEEINLPAWV